MRLRVTTTPTPHARTERRERGGEAVLVFHSQVQRSPHPVEVALRGLERPAGQAGASGIGGVARSVRPEVLTPAELSCGLEGCETLK